MKQLTALLIALLIGLGLGYYATPTKIETKIVVEKEKNLNKDKFTIITETTFPDGRIEKRTEIVDKSTFNSHTHSDTFNKQEKIPPSWQVSALAGTNLQGQQAYGGMVQRRVFGNVHVGGWGLSSGMFGVSVGLSF